MFYCFETETARDRGDLLLVDLDRFLLPLLLLLLLCVLSLGGTQPAAAFAFLPPVNGGCNTGSSRSISSSSSTRSHLCQFHFFVRLSFFILVLIWIFALFLVTGGTKKRL